MSAATAAAARNPKRTGLISVRMAYCRQPYSVNATRGSIRVARRAGSAHAATATSASTAAAPVRASGIGGRNLEELALQRAPQRDRAGGAQHETDADKRQTFAQDQIEDPAGRCCRARA